MEGDAARRNWAAPVAGSAGEGGGKRLGTHQGSIWVLGWDWGRAGIGVPRRGRVASAWSSAPVSSRPGQQRGRRGATPAVQGDKG
jgi:hypothetical protein